MGSTAWGSLTLQKPYITFWISKWPESSSSPPPGRAHGTLSSHPPGTGTPGQDGRWGERSRAQGDKDEDLTSRRCQLQVIGAILVRVEGPGEAEG